MKLFLTLAAICFAMFISAQDNIILKNGSEISGKVVRIGTAEIEYTKDTTSPVYAIKKGDVFMVKYANGNKDVLADVSKSENTVDLKMKYERARNASIGLLTTAGVLFVSGSVLMGIDGGSGGVLTIAAISAGCTGVPLLIGGGVALHRYVKLKREWKKRASISVAPKMNGVTFAVNF